MYFQVCGTSDDEAVLFQLPMRPALMGSGEMQFGGVCRGMSDSIYATSAWYIDENDDYVRFSSDEAIDTAFTGSISIQGQFQYEV